jgi:hypothetical protein
MATEESASTLSTCLHAPHDSSLSLSLSPPFSQRLIIALLARHPVVVQAPGYVANTAQRRLAEEVTRFVHGEEGLQQALKTTQALAPGAGGWADGRACGSAG